VPLTTESGQKTYLDQANQLSAMYWNSLGMSPSNPTGNLSNAPGIQNATSPSLPPGSYATSGYMQNASVSNPRPASSQPLQPSGPMNPFSGKSPTGGVPTNTSQSGQPEVMQTATMGAPAVLTGGYLGERSVPIGQGAK